MTPRLSLRVVFLTLLCIACAVQAQGGVYRGNATVVPPEFAPVRRHVGPWDIATWQYWWEFNKERILYEKRDGRPRAGVPANDITGKILPALLSTMEGTTPPRVRAGSLMAMAKIARKFERPKLRDLLLDATSEAHPLVREAGILGLGIAGISEATPVLEDLARDTAEGHKRLGRATVDDRTRALACYSLGLIAQRSPDLYVKGRVFKTLFAVVGAAKPPSAFDVQVAAILGISILNIPADKRIVGNQELRKEVLAGLDKLREGSTLKPAVKSHIPGAIARLIGRGSSEVHGRYKAAFLAILQDPKANRQMHRGIALALGQITEEPEVHAKDQEISAALRRYARGRRDEQAGYFVLIALGQIGGEANREFLLRILARGKKVLERPWAAMALGEMAFHRRSRDPKAKADEEVGKFLLEQIRIIRTPMARAAMALALGMCRYHPAATELASYAEKYRHQDSFCGRLCISVALLGGRDAAADIVDIVEVAVRRPQLVQQAVPALAVLGDRTATKSLLALLRRESSNLNMSSAVAAALGAIDDPNAIPGLVDILKDPNMLELNRAFAAVALGGIADPEPLPFYWRMAIGLNYRAAVSTLVSLGTGVLEQL